MVNNRIVPVTPVICNVATFNVKNMGNNNDQKLIWIADTIRTASPDIVSLQEVKSLAGITTMMGYLGADWDCLSQNKSISNGQNKEYNVFIYKKNRVRAIMSFTFTSTDFQTYIGNNKIMIRSPMYARFIIDNAADLVLISYHTNPANAILECMQIKKNIKAIKIKNNCKNVIALGDFNADCDNKLAFSKLINDGWIASLPSSIPTNFNGKDQYDNIWYHPSSCELLDPAHVFRECIPEGSTIDTYTDHCLVMSKFAINGGMSANAETFQPPDMAEAMRKTLMGTIAQIFQPPVIPSLPEDLSLNSNDENEINAVSNPEILNSDNEHEKVRSVNISEKSNVVKQLKIPFCCGTFITCNYD